MLINGHRFTRPLPAEHPVRFDVPGVFCVIDVSGCEPYCDSAPRTLYVGTTEELIAIAFPWGHPRFLEWLSMVKKRRHLGFAVTEDHQTPIGARVLAEHLIQTVNPPGNRHRRGLADLYRSRRHAATT